MDGDPDLEDSDYSSEGMIGKPRKARGDDEFVYHNRLINKAPHFVNATRKKHIALHQVFKDHKEFAEVLRDYAIEDGFEFY